MYNPRMQLTKDEVKKVAKLANLPLTEKEEEKFAEQLSETLSYVESLNEVDTGNVDQTSQVTGLVNVTREDEVVPSFTQEQVLSNVKSSYQGFIKVEAILEET